MSKDLPNNSRNKEAFEAINNLKQSDNGVLSHKPASIAETIGLLNVAESLQLLQLQSIETSRANRSALKEVIDGLIESNEKLAKSNDKHSNAMTWLTTALVIVGIAQVVVTFIVSFKK